MTNQIKRDSFIFYRSFFETIEDLEDNQQLQIYKAIAEYSLNDKSIKLEGISKTIFRLIEPQLLANKKRFINGSKGAEHGVKGGRPKTPKKPLDNPNLTPNKNNNLNVNVNLNENLNLKSKLECKSEIIELVEGLQFILEAKLNKKINTSSWKEPIRLLVEKDLAQRENAIEDVKRAIQEVGNRFGEQYFPVIQSGGSLREKFSKIENAMRNNTQTNKPKLQESLTNLWEKYDNE